MLEALEERGPRYPMRSRFFPDPEDGRARRRFAVLSSPQNSLPIRFTMLPREKSARSTRICQRYALLE